MKKKFNRQPKYRLLKAGCLSAGLLSISNPTQVWAWDLGIIDVQNASPLTTFPNPFPNAALGVHVAAGDLNGDGHADIIVGPGSGPPGVAVTESVSFNYTKIKWDYQPQKGVRVAAGDVDGDGRADIITSNAYGGESTAIYIKFPSDYLIDPTTETLATFDNIFDDFSGGVSVASLDPNGPAVGGSDEILAGRLSCACGRPIKKWPPTSGIAGFEDYGPPIPSGQGGVQIATGDLDGDGLDDILVLPIDPASGISTPLVARASEKHKNWIEIGSFTEPAGVHIALGDVDNDGISDLIVGSARGTGPFVKVYKIDFNDLVNSFTADKKHDFIPYDSSFLGGVRVAAGDVNGDGYSDIVFGPAAIPEPTTIASLLAGLGSLLLGRRPRRRD